jgi:hypothetical protein
MAPSLGPPAGREPDDIPLVGGLPIPEAMGTGGRTDETGIGCFTICRTGIGLPAPDFPVSEAGVDGLGGSLLLGASNSPARILAFFSALMTLPTSALGSTNRPIHISVSGYENGPTDSVTRAMHSVSCAGATSSSSAARLARACVRAVDVDFPSSDLVLAGLGLDPPGLAALEDDPGFCGPWYSR